MQHEKMKIREERGKGERKKGSILIGNVSQSLMRQIWSFISLRIVIPSLSLRANIRMKPSEDL